MGRYVRIAFVFMLSFMSSIMETLAQGPPGPPGPNPPCFPNPCPVPISDYMWILVVVAGIYFGTKINKQKQQQSQQIPLRIKK